MPGVARNNDTIATGHGCSTTSNVLGLTGLSAQVFADGISVVCLGDPTVVHTIGPPCYPHTAVVNVASTTVFVGGVGVARIGDSVDLGTITGGSATVFAGG